MSSAQPKPTAADVLLKHAAGALMGPTGNPRWVWCTCDHTWRYAADHAQHQADALAAAEVEVL